MRTALRRYYWGDELVAMREVQASTTSYYRFDHQGTTQCLTDSSGSVTDRFASDAWGVQVKRTGTSINRQRYIGASGYYRKSDRRTDYIRARYYSSATARWESREPLNHYDAANQLLCERHPIAGVKTWAYGPVGNRLSQDFTQVGTRTLTNWSYDAADQITLEATGSQVTVYTFDRAGNEQIVSAPSGVTTNTWDSDNRLLGISMPDGALNTMTYCQDGLRLSLNDSEGNKQLVWDLQGGSGYGDLLDERLP